MPPVALAARGADRHLSIRVADEAVQRGAGRANARVTGAAVEVTMARAAERTYLIAGLGGADGGVDAVKVNVGPVIIRIERRRRSQSGCVRSKVNPHVFCRVVGRADDVARPKVTCGCTQRIRTEVAVRPGGAVLRMTVDALKPVSGPGIPTITQADYSRIIPRWSIRRAQSMARPRIIRSCTRRVVESAGFSSLAGRRICVNTKHVRRKGLTIVAAKA